MLTTLRSALAAHLTAILMFRVHAPRTDMALLAEGEKPFLGSYKHDPPDGGQEVQTEVLHTSESYKSTLNRTR